MAQFDLKAVITAEDRASSKISKVGSTFTSLAKIGIAGAVTGVSALTAGLYSCVKAFEESEKVTAQTNAALLSTKGISGMTAKSISDLANEIMSYSGISDEAVQTGENMLLTFTNIGKDVFPQATKALADMAARMSGGAIPTAETMNTTAIQLGKALNNPIQGVTALRRVGVQMTDQQEKLIEKFVESGNVMSAQKIILQELQTEFGGSAEAIGTTFAGKLAIAREQMGNLQETIGGALLNAINPLLTQLSAWASNPDVQKKIQEIATEMGNWITKVAIPWIEEHWPAIKKAGEEAIQGIYNLLKELVNFARSPEGQILIATLGVAYVMQQLAIVRQALLGIMSGNPYIVSLVIAIWGFHQAKEEMGRVMEKARKTEGPWYVKLNTAMAYDQAAGLWENIKRIFYRAVLGPVSLLMSVGGAFAGAFGRQHGGPVLGGMPYLVGERGPELFVPNTAGRIVPNNEVNNNQVTVNFHGNINNTSNTSLDDIGARISRQIQLAQQGI